MVEPFNTISYIKKFANASFTGLMIGFCFLYFSSAYEKSTMNILFEIKELRKENNRIQTNIIELVKTSQGHTKDMFEYLIRMKLIEKQMSDIVKNKCIK